MDRSIRNLLEKILSRQFCYKCENYLSIGPVTISSNGDVICGRCSKDSDAVASLYNAIAEKRRFKCINHYAGCDKWLLFGEEASVHEAQCTYKANYNCPFCEFSGNGCQLVFHFGKWHVNSLVGGDTVDQIISYNDPGVDYILNLDDSSRQLFVSTALDVFAKCDKCKQLFSNAYDAYVCPKYHSVCTNCSLYNCLKCNKTCQWNNRSRLHHIQVPCEWKNCRQQPNIFTHLSHKRVCKFRQYICPDKDCGYVSKLEKIWDHWHLNPIKLEEKISIPSENAAFYWLIPRHNELVYVTVRYDGETVMVMITENNCVCPHLFNYFIEFGSRTSFHFEYNMGLATCRAPKMTMSYYLIFKPLILSEYVFRPIISPGYFR